MTDMHFFQLHSQIQEATTDSCQATACPRGQDSSHRRHRSARAQGAPATANHQPAGLAGRFTRGGARGGREAGGTAQGHAQGEESQDQGGQLPQVHVNVCKRAPRVVRLEKYYVVQVARSTTASLGRCTIPKELYIKGYYGLRDQYLCPLFIALRVVTRQQL